MNKKEKKDLTIHISNILEKSKSVDYRLVDFKNDNDINFFVMPKLKSLKTKDEHNFMFLMYCSDKTMLTIYCPTMYLLKDKDSAMYTLNAINNVNSNMAIGKIYLNKTNNSVISYINRILFNDISRELTVELFEEYVRSFLMTSIEFYEQMKVDNI